MGEDRARRQPEPVDSLLRRARGGEETAFGELSRLYRRQLLVHCYRILGSVDDAEDLVQETLMVAWRGLDRFREQGSFRSWLYTIATNRCLNALRDRRRRPPAPDPSDQGPEPRPPTRFIEPLWLEPIPDAALEGIADEAPGPEALYESREAIELAFIAGLQRLPPQQRAVLVLRDVLGFRAAEVAGMLAITEAAAAGALRRARSALRPGPSLAGSRESAPLPDSRAEREVVSRFRRAFEAGDVETLIALLTDDAKLTMPPAPLEYRGSAIIEFLTTVPAAGRLELFALIPTRANGQPAFGCYLTDENDGGAVAYGLMVLGLSGRRVAEITGFPDTAIFERFGLPQALPRKPGS